MSVFKSFVLDMIEERLNDNGEYIEYSGQVLNTWEAYGFYRKPEKGNHGFRVLAGYRNAHGTL